MRTQLVLLLCIGVWLASTALSTEVEAQKTYLKMKWDRAEKLPSERLASNFEEEDEDDVGPTGEYPYQEQETAYYDDDYDPEMYPTSTMTYLTTKETTSPTTEATIIPTRTKATATPTTEATAAPTTEETTIPTTTEPTTNPPTRDPTITHLRTEATKAPPTTETTTTTKRTTPPDPCRLNSPCRFNGSPAIPSPDNCSEFIVCISGQPNVHTCSRKKIWCPSLCDCVLVPGSQCTDC